MEIVDLADPEFQRRSSVLVSWAIWIAVVSGTAALVHQLIWTRRMIDLLGASHESTARVFGTFFLGLAIGSAVAAVVLNRVNRPWRWLATAELLVILFALPAILLPWWSEGLWRFLGTDVLLDWRGSFVKLLASVLVVLPPATAMGLTLPLLCHAVLVGQSRIGREGIWIYAVNTLGGMLGLILASLFFLNWFGATGTLILAIGLSGIVILCASLLDRLSPQHPSERSMGDWEPNRFIDSARETSERGKYVSEFSIMGWPLLIAGVSGFGVLAYEVAAMQVAMLVAPLSFYAPAVILAVIIGMLAVAAAATPGVIKQFESAESFLVWSLSVTGCLTAVTPIWFLWVAKRLGGLEGSGHFYVWLLGILTMILITIGPAIFCAAFTFPATLAWIGQTADPRGRRLGWLLAVNGVGGWFGAELGYRFLLPYWGLYPTFGLLGLIYLAMAIAICSKNGNDDHSYRFAVVGVMVSLFLMLVWLPKLPTINPSLGFELIASRSGREGTVAVINQPNNQRAMLMSNQYILGSTSARWEQERQAHLALLLHAEPAEVAVIGLATGMTAGAVLQHSTVNRLTVIELSPLVLELAEEYFQDYHGQLFSDARTRIVQEDGRTYMAAAGQQYDVVIGDLFLPWGPGEARLFSREHFQSVKQSLRPGGVYCQWLPMFQLTDQQFRIIAATFADVFSDVDLIVNGLDVNQPALGLVGFHDGGIDFDAIEIRVEQSRKEKVLDPIVRQMVGFQLVYLGKFKDHDSTPINTLDNLWIELDAGRRRVTEKPFEIYQMGPRWLEWLKTAPIQWSRWQNPSEEPPQLIQFLEYELRMRQQPLVILPQALLDLMESFRQDQDADRNRWPAQKTWLLDDLR